MYFANALAPAFERKATAGMFRVFSSQVDSPDDSENAAKQESRVPVLIQLKPNAL